MEFVHRFVPMAAAFVLVMAALASAPAARSHPKLTVRSASPVRVGGSQFRPGERVRITSTLGPVRTVRANRAGAFAVTLSARPLDRCSGFSVRAIGSAGSIASLKRPRPECLSARTPASAARVGLA
jgi:hypothetical protein